MTRRDLTGSIVVFATAAFVFWRTSYPTITWWDSSSYSLAAVTLGIASAPGSLLLTLLGWSIAKLSTAAATAHVLNLVAGILAALTATLVYKTALQLVRAGRGQPSGTQTNGAMAVGAALGALTFAFANTTWEYAVMFTPYILSALFTTLIFATMMQWWERAHQPNAWRLLVLLAFLFGVDFSVHRTNALLLPGALCWILIRNRHTLTEWRTWLGGACGLIAGLAVQLLVIPIAAFGRSPLNFNDPSSWSRFWDYITLRQLGGSFLLQLFPRKADVWSVQVVDVVRVIGENFFHWNGSLGALGLLPGVAAIVGAIALWRVNRRLAVAFSLVLSLQAVTTVLYFNIPANYFRAFDRHYLPLCVTIGVLGTYGLAVAAEWTQRAIDERTRIVAVSPFVCAVLLSALPISQLASNWHTRDASRRYFAHDWAVNALQALPRDAIYFTVGDNDTFPAMYVQAVEGVRRDVTIINLSVAAQPGYAERIRRRDQSFPLDTNVMPIDVARHSIAAGKRTVVYAVTTANSGTEWPREYARFEGLHWRIVAASDTSVDIAVARATLLEKSQYRGFADPTMAIDPATRIMAYQYYAAGATLFAIERARGDIMGCRSDRSALFKALPPDLVGISVDYRATLESACESDASDDAGGKSR